MNFEQVPLADVLKKIAPNEIGKRRKRGTDDVVAEPLPRPRERPGHFHGVQFYKDSDALCRIVGGFVGEGLEQGDLAILIATPDHSLRIEDCLRGRGIDVDDMKRHRRLITWDARETLRLFMADGMPDPGEFRRVIGSVLAQSRRGREQCAVRAYGEMVQLLWQEGLEAAAIRLETQWNQLAATHDFNLLCGYSMGNFYKGAAIEEIQHQHTHTIAGDGDATELPAFHAESATAP